MELPRPIKPEEFAERHLEGDTILGVYLIDPDTNNTYCSCLDFDDHSEDADGEQAIADARTVTRFLHDNNVDAVLEISQSGNGAHVWIIHSQPIAARSVRKFWKAVLQQCQVKAEIYPKQDTLEGTGKGLGNFVRYPLSGASHFESVTVTGLQLDPLDVLENIVEASPYLIQSKTEAWFTSETELGQVRAFDTEGLPERVRIILNEEPDSLLARRWADDIDGMADSSRSARVQAIATELVRHYVPTPEIMAAIQWWMSSRNYEKHIGWVEDAVIKAYAFVQGLAVKESVRVGTFAGMVHKTLDRMRESIILPTGIASLDRSIKGVEIGELAVLAGRPGSGKTAMLLEWMEAAAECGFPGLMFSLEMGATPISKRVLSRIGYVEGNPEGISLRQAHALVDARYEAMAPLYFEDSTYDITKMCETIRRYATNKGVQFVAIDHHGCIKTRQTDEYARLSESVKILADLKKSLDIAIVLLVHLRRDFEDKGKGPVVARPQMRHLRGTGDIENYADLILAGRWMHNEDPQGGYDEDEYRFHVLKCRNRDAKSLDVEASFDRVHQKFH